MTQTTTPRPSTRDQAIMEAAARAVAESLVKHGCFEESEQDDIARDILREIRCSDGYELARALDRSHGWSPTAEMVEILDTLSYELAAAHSRAQAEWAKQVSIEPPLPIGARVVLKGFRATEAGEITGIYQHGVYQYLVRVDGDPKADAPTIARRIINFEDAVAEPASTGAAA